MCSEDSFSIFLSGRVSRKKIFCGIPVTADKVHLGNFKVGFPVLFICVFVFGLNRVSGNKHRELTLWRLRDIAF